MPPSDKSQSDELRLLETLNRALYRAFFIDAEAAARWERIEDELDEETKGALCFDIVSMEPPSEAMMEQARRMAQERGWKDVKS
jgi:hypothetical protein